MLKKYEEKIKDLNLKIESRNKFIRYQTEKISQLEAILRQINSLASSNKYNNEKAYLRKIKELVRPLNQY